MDHRKKIQSGATLINGRRSVMI